MACGLGNTENLGTSLVRLHEENELTLLLENHESVVSYDSKFAFVMSHVKIQFSGVSFLFITVNCTTNINFRYVGEMLSWIQGAISAEREILISAVLKSCQPENITAFSKSVLSNISEALCQPLRVAVCSN